MGYKGIAILALLMGATAAVYAQEESPIRQLRNLDSQPAAVVPRPVAPNAGTDSPIKNFGVAIWKNSESGRQEGLVFRGAAPQGEAAFRFLGELGVKTVIDFRVMRHDDKELCADNSIECLEYGIIPTPTEKLVKDEEFMRAFTRAADDMKAGRKVFIHCLGGHHRTGALVAALMIRDAACDKPFDKAQLSDSMGKTLKEYGFYTTSGSLHRFTAWEKEIRGWVDNFEENQWLCK